MFFCRFYYNKVIYSKDYRSYLFVLYFDFEVDIVYGNYLL